MIDRFHTLTVATCVSTQATAPTAVTMVDNVISVLFDEQLRSDAPPPYASNDDDHVWTEANVHDDGGQAETVVDAIDVIAR